MFRGDESHADYQFVEQIANSGILFLKAKELMCQHILKQTGESSQLSSRMLRFAFFEEIMDKHQCRYARSWDTMAMIKSKRCLCV